MSDPMSHDKLGKDRKFFFARNKFYSGQIKVLEIGHQILESNNAVILDCIACNGRMILTKHKFKGM
jgi:hypothetical protein